MINQIKAAFDEIEGERGLPTEVVIEALQSALVSAYRRDSGASSAQEIEARIDPQTGRARIFVEKEVVDDIYNDDTEVTLEKARFYNPEAQYGDTVMVQVEVPAKKFGRIAAQTAKQVILQKIREAERNSIFDEFIAKEGDLIMGIVQNMNASVVTLQLGDRAEGILPRSQQIPGERYRQHEKLRVYIMEVTRGNKGPQIVCSRSHRNMLRKLLEYEVPELYNGQVEIKSIAREAGYRSKVAVAALQEGVDPVGACVGMRGIRIQNIVKELHDEKIDVIEWSPDTESFISKALSPARVTGVYLDDDPQEGRTAIVIVPDDQLSLAIGREGQNARLAAKLTGWRIDIKSITETAQAAMDNIDAEPLRSIAEQHPDLVDEIHAIMEKKANNKTVMPEEYSRLAKFANLVETALQEEREDLRRAEQKQIDAVRATLPQELFEIPLDVLGLPEELTTALSTEFDNVGEIMLATLTDDRALKIALRNIEGEPITRVHMKLDDLMESEIDLEDFIPAEEAEETEPLLEEDLMAEAETPATEILGEEETEAEEEAVVLESDELESVEAAVTEAVDEAIAETDEETLETADMPAAEVEEVVDTPTTPDHAELTTVDVDPAVTETEVESPLMDYDEYDEKPEETKRERRRKRRLVYDEETGEIVAKRRRSRDNE